MQQKTGQKKQVSNRDYRIKCLKITIPYIVVEKRHIIITDERRLKNK
jgi:hypothetical protein